MAIDPQLKNGTIEMKFPITYTTTVNADYLTQLSENYEIKVLPKDEAKPAISNGLKEQLQVYNKHLIHVTIQKKANQMEVENDIDHIVAEPIQQIVIFCDCNGDVDDSGVCSRVKDMGVITTELNDDEEDEPSR